MQSGFMVIDVELSGGGAVELCGQNAKYWRGEGLPDYEGDITGLPDAVFSELLMRRVIKEL
jgi:hypothetical protein